MTSPLPAREILEREFLEIRAELLRIAASLDRIDRGAGAAVTDDPRLQKLLAAIEILQSPEPDRAEKLQQASDGPPSPDPNVPSGRSAEDDRDAIRDGKRRLQKLVFEFTG